MFIIHAFGDRKELAMSSRSFKIKNFRFAAFVPKKDCIYLCLKQTSGFKGTVSRDFLLQVFFMNHLPPSP
jgi:hypothetical protein